MPYVLKEGKIWVSWESIPTRSCVWNQMASKLYNFVNHNYLCKESMSASQSTEFQVL